MPEPSPTRSRIADVDVADPGRPWEALEDLEATELRLYALGWGDHLPVELDKRIETIRRRKLALEERLLAVGDRAPRSTRISMLGSPAFRPGRSVNFAHRQQYRRLMRAVMASAGCAAVAMLGLLAAGAGAVTLDGLLLLAAGALGIRARRWLALAGRSRVGAQSEDEVQRALARLEGEGWRLRHSLPWRRPGDIDSIAIAPSGVAFAIETKCPNVRCASPSGRARDGAVASPPPAALVPARGAPGPVRRAGQRSGADRGRGTDRLA